MNLQNISTKTLNEKIEDYTKRIEDLEVALKQTNSILYQLSISVSIDMYTKKIHKIKAELAYREQYYK